MTQEMKDSPQEEADRKLSGNWRSYYDGDCGQNGQQIRVISFTLMTGRWEPLHPHQ